LHERGDLIRNCYLQLALTLTLTYGRLVNGGQDILCGKTICTSTRPVWRMGCLWFIMFQFRPSVREVGICLKDGKIRGEEGGIKH
jgi:hypothetical protein